MKTLGQIVFWIAYRLSFLTAKWRLAWSYWNVDGKNIDYVMWKD